MFRAPRLPGSELVALLGSALPSENARQTLADAYIEAGVGRPADRRWRVLDLGCGAGDSVDAFRRRDPDVEWVGLDIERSPEVQVRTRRDSEFVTFDGVSIPFEDERFDLVYCKQALEHAAQPAPLLADVRRVLARGGFLAGSTSQLEPYHSLSTQNFTPYGLARLLAGVGLEVVEIRPGIDGLALVARRLTAGSLDRWWTRESPLNRFLELAGRLTRADARHISAAKLLFSGHFTFLAQRPPMDA